MPGAIIAAVIPLAMLLVGAAALVAGIAVLRTFGPRYRVGRLLSSTPQVSVAEALATADGQPRYVRIAGRIDAEDEFEDEHHRPLVLRRTRLDLRDGRAWRTFEDHRDLVRFEVREGLDGIVVDGDALDDGLVVVPRESIGTAGDVADRVPAGTEPQTPVRLRVDQVSSVEQAIVTGVARRGPDGTVRMTSGLGRPLVLSTMEPSEAMRLLAGGGTRRPLIAAICLSAGLVLVTLAAVWAVLDAIL
jgi:hypothetical protein